MHRAVVAGRVTLPRFGAIVPGDAHQRTVRLRVLAADRAGNVTQRTRVVALVRR